MITPPRFAALKAQFDQHFADGEELGARFTLVEKGEVVFDAWGGFADREKTRAFDDQTLTPVFSTTKAIAAILIARLVDAGKLAYAQPVADVWPQFAANGKAAITIEQAMSHQAGLPGFLEPMDPAEWFDWDAICAKLAAMAPMWPPGTASGYHAITFGYLAGEIFRRVDGRTMGTALREDIASPLGLDLFIGLPDAEFARTASLEKPHGIARFGPITDPIRAAFLTKWAAPGGRGTSEWRRAEIPSANGHATALSLATLMGALATDGKIGERTILSPGGIANLSRERIHGRDLVLPYEVSWGAGVMRNGVGDVYGSNPDSFGHSGWGGSCTFADPARGVAMAYVMNKQNAELIGDSRSKRLIRAAYEAL